MNDPVRTPVDDAPALRSQLERNGFVVLRQALGPEFMARYRDVLVEHFRKRQRQGAVDALGRFPKTRILLEQSELFERVAAVLGYRPNYCHHSDIQTNRVTTWHRDSVDRPTYCDFAKTEIFDTRDYAVYKICVYCQDHQDGGGLSVIPGSHLAPGPPDVRSGVAIPTQLGDVILFDTRLYHQGIPSLRDRGSTVDRISCFMTLAGDNQITREFVNATIWRQNRQLRRKSYELRGDLAEVLERVRLPAIAYERAPRPSTFALVKGFVQRTTRRFLPRQGGEY